MKNATIADAPQVIRIDPSTADPGSHPERVEQLTSLIRSADLPYGQIDVRGAGDAWAVLGDGALIGRVHRSSVALPNGASGDAAVAAAAQSTRAGETVFTDAARQAGPTASWVEESGVGKLVTTATLELTNERTGVETPKVAAALASCDDARVPPSALTNETTTKHELVQDIQVHVVLMSDAPPDPTVNQPVDYRHATVALAVVPNAIVRVYNKDAVDENGAPKLLAEYTAKAFDEQAESLAGLPSGFAVRPGKAWKEKAAAMAVPDGWVAQSFDLPSNRDWLPEDTLLISQQSANHPESAPVEVELEAAAGGKRRGDAERAEKAERLEAAQTRKATETTQRFSKIVSAVHEALRQPACKGSITFELDGLPPDFQLKLVHPLTRRTLAFEADKGGGMRVEVSRLTDGDGLQYEVASRELPFAVDRTSVEIGSASKDSALQQRFARDLSHFSPAAKAIAADLFLPGADGTAGPLQNHAGDWAMALTGYLIGAQTPKAHREYYANAMRQQGKDDMLAGFMQPPRDDRRARSLPENCVWRTKLTFNGAQHQEYGRQWGRGETWRHAIITPGNKYRVYLPTMKPFDFGLPTAFQGRGFHM